MANKITKGIPNTITLLNLLSGAVAIYFAFHYNEQYGSLLGWQLAAISIGAAAIFDFCDGFAARLLHAKSDIGKELDSLCDVVSFGVAPAMLLLNVMEGAGAGLWSFAALFIPMMGALRLAIFNLDESQSTSFKGLPIPANAIFWIGAIAAMYQWGFHPTLSVMIVVIAAASLLMVSKLKMFSLKFVNLRLRDNFFRYLLIVATVIFVIFWGVAGFAATIILYIIISVLRTIVKVSYE